MKPQKILVVDDEERVRDMIAFRLGLFGYEVVKATSGGEAVRVASEEEPDLILLDIMMPDLDGFQTCRQLKQSEATQDIPVVMLTARAEAKDVSRALESGAVDYVVKPYDPVVLQEKVARNLRPAPAEHR